MTLASAALGLTLTREGVVINGLLSIAPPGVGPELPDTSSHDGTWETFVAALLRSGEVNMSLNYDPGDVGHLAMVNSAISTATAAYEIGTDATPTPGIKWSFNALCRMVDQDLGTPDALVMNFLLRPTGIVTRAYA